MNTFYHTYSTTNDWNLLSRLQTVRPHTLVHGCDLSHDSVLLHLRAVESAWRGHLESARCVYALMDGWSVQTTDVVSPAGHRRKRWRMVPTWYAQGLLQQEAQNHRAQIKWEREREREKRKIKRDALLYIAARLLLTWVRKQEVDCITNKHREQEGGRWESPHWQRMWSAQHIWELSENHRPPSYTHTHIRTHTRTFFPPRLYRSMVRTGGRSQPSSDHPPSPIPPFRWSRLLSPPRFYSHNSCHRRGPRQPHTNTHVLSLASHCGKCWQFVTSTSPKNEDAQRSHTLGRAFMQTAHSDLSFLVVFNSKVVDRLGRLSCLVFLVFDFPIVTSRWVFLIISLQPDAILGRVHIVKVL